MTAPAVARRRHSLLSLLALVFAALLLPSLTGCAALRSLVGADDESAAAPAGNPAPGGPPAFDVSIDAPAPLERLLETHLDLVRLRTLDEGRNLDPAEWNRLLAAAPQQVDALLQTEGYFEARVEVARETGPRPRVRITVHPGPRTTVGAVRIELQGDLESEAIEGRPAAVRLRDRITAAWPLPSGAPFRDDDWSRAKTSMVADLRAAGYSAATLAGSSARVQVEQRSAELLVIVDSGPVFRAGDIVVKGLALHDEQTVRNLAGLKRGDILTESALLDYQERLANANLFGGVTVVAEADPDRAEAATITVQVSELKPQQATFGVGISANTGPRTTVDYTHRRPFGAAVILRNQLEYGRDLQSLELDVSTHPGPDFYRNLVGLQLQRLSSDTDIVRSARLRVGRTQQTPRLERFHFVELEDSKRSVTVASTERPEDVQALSVNTQWIWRDLDSILLPTRGYSLSLQGGVGVAQSPTAQRGPFARVYGRLTGYRPLGHWYGTARIELGEVFSASDVETPDSQRFRAGGDDSVRGYDYRSLAPTTGIVVSSGKVLATGSVEVARPLIERLPDLWGALFVDAGTAADSWGSLDPALGYGVGLRYRSPIGPLKLDLAYGERVEAFRLHFSIGIAF